jgi:protease-4
MQSWMNEIYTVFKGHVVAIRGPKLAKPIDELAGGRVFTGKQALELGLIDQLGGLDDAIRHAAQQANVSQYDVRVLPPPKSFLEVLLSDLQDGGGQDSKSLFLRLGDSLGQRHTLLQAALPQLQALEPRRLRSAWLGLWQLQQLQHERVLTAMPVIDLVD